MNDNESEYLLRWVARIFRYSQAYMARRLEPVGIGLGQYPYIIALCRNPNINQDRLREMFFLNKSTVARSVAHLEEHGFVTRRVNPVDKRAYELVATDKARETLPLIFEGLRECIDTLTEGLDPEEVLLATRLLEQMAAKAEAIKDRHHSPAEKEAT